MYRFVALSWNSKDPAKTAEARRLTRCLRSSAREWQQVLTLPGLRVFHVRETGGARRAYILKRDAGVILGKLFSDDDTSTAPTFDETESKLIVDSRGRRVTERYWGHYVAFLQMPHNGQRLVLRDPTGGLPCFMAKAAGVDLVFSNIEDGVQLGRKTFSVDWDHLTAFFRYSELNTRTTGSSDVTQLYAGECATITQSGALSRSFYWTPAEICKADPIENPDEARAALREVIQRCVRAWASSYGSIVQELSGGLDSSIVTACVNNAKSDADVLCFHFYTETIQGDERAYARAAARAAGYKLIESLSPVSECSLESLLDLSRVASPAVLGFLPPSELLRQRLVSERPAGAVFTGQGGDHLFQQESSPLIAADYAFRHGLRPGLLRAAADTSLMTKSSIWSVLSTAAIYGLLRRSSDPYSDYDKAPSILSADLRNEVNRDSYSHPWVEAADDLAPGKKLQIFNVVGCQTYYLRPCSYAELIHPLISQPIIECCLSIPSYVLTCGGRSRGLVRDAFAQDVPAEIIRRYSKGSTSSYFNRILARNAAFLRSFLLNGALVKNGVLDKHELERQLSDQELLRGDNVSSVLDAVRAEAWLSAWSGARKRVAA